MNQLGRLWVFGVFLTFPFAVILWGSHVAVMWIIKLPSHEVPPTRWLAASLLPLIVAGWGLRRGSVSKSGAFLGFVVGFVLTLSNFCFFASLMVFFVTSSKLTKFRSEKKKLFEADYRGQEGNRNWIQVLCNGGIQLILGLLYLVDVGVGEYPLDFYRQYRATWLSLGVIGAFACACGDTWASEVGSVFGGLPKLITDFKSVPRGTNGGITLGGLICSLVGGLAIGFTYYFGLLIWADSTDMRQSGPQWPVILVGALAGFFGSVIDSIFGATLQYSGVDKKTGRIVEHPGPSVVHISGIRLLDNHSVNLLSTVSTGILTPIVAQFLWPISL